MSFLLDTDICSAFLKNRGGLAHRFMQHSGRLHISSIVVGELYVWAYRRSNVPAAIARLEKELLPHVVELPFVNQCAHEFGRLRAILLNQGTPMDGLDSAIAATALVYNFTLVTHNTKDYRFVPSLRLDDWLVS